MKNLFAILLALGLLVGCTEPQPSANTYQVYVFGTLVDITIWGAETQQEEKAVAAISQDFQRMHHDWHAWNPGPLVDINKAIAAGQPAKVIPSLIPIIEQSTVLSRQSEGLFDPAIGGLLNLWGFQSDGRPNGPPPDKAAIEKWVAAAPRMDDLKLDGDQLRSTNPAVQLDFGAFAKGYAVDLAIARLREFGIDNAIINAGGDLRAIGSKGGKPWRVGIRHPQGQGVLAALEVSGDESVFTSGNYERYREYEGVHYNHILDPRTGMPVDGVTSVTVIHDNGAVADAAATALVVAGPKAWHRIAKQMGIKYVMLVDDAGVVYMNPAMQRRVVFQDAPPANIRISDPLWAMSITIEPADMVDLDSLCRLLQQLFAIEADFHFDLAKVRQGLQRLLEEERACVLAARDHSTVIGMCTAQLVISTAEGAYSAWVEDVVVDKEHRGKGIGRQLLDNIGDWAKRHGAKRLQLLVDAENIAALEFYRHNGWRTTQLRALRTIA